MHVSVAILFQLTTQVRGEDITVNLWTSLKITWKERRKQIN